MKRLAVLAILAAAALAQPPQPQPQQPGPWSEQPPVAQRPPYPAGPYGGPPAQPEPANDGSAPDRGVARISFMNGNVSVRRGDSADLVAAIVNAPLTIGDRLVTADGARAEVELDSSNVLRLGPSTEVRFSQLAYHQYQIEIATGTTSFRMLRDSDAQVEISTPSVEVHPLRKGVYRVTVNPDGSSEITVRGGGDSEIASPKGTEQLHSGQSMLARGSASDPEFQVTAPLPEDDLDRWAASRDQQFQNARSPQYVNRDVSGAEDMDGAGRWANDPAYGNVWVPSEGPGWAPYQCGRWVWMDYYGWTWIGCEPWAWAPYHYGRWYYGSFGWSWWPGPMVGSYFWSPALVGFFGFGAPGFGVGFGFGFGSLGWVPLAPFERFRPWYGPGMYGGFRSGSVVAGTNVASIYRNARVANGVSAMRANEFGSASVNRANLIRPSAQELAHAGAIRGQVPLSPSRASTQFSSRAASSAGMPRTSENTRFFSRNSGSQVSRVPFDQQRQSFNQAARSGFNNNRGVGGGSATRSSTTGANSGGWQRFDPSRSTGATMNRQMPGQGSRGSSPSSQNTSQNSGWQRFESGRSSSSGAARPMNSQQPVRINPPIVQSRGSSSSSRGGGSRGGGSRGGRH